jgi:hypothetical protein
VLVRRAATRRILIRIAAALAVVALGYAVFVVSAKLYQRGIRTYAQAAIVDIVSDWNEQALLRRASPELFAITNRQEIDDVFLKYRQLGRLTGLSKGIGHLDVVYTTAGIRMTAVYIARVRFEQRSVAVKLSLIWHRGDWQIMGFDIMPDRPTESSSFGQHSNSDFHCWHSSDHASDRRSAGTPTLVYRARADGLWAGPILRTDGATKLPMNMPEEGRWAIKPLQHQPRVRTPFALYV